MDRAPIGPSRKPLETRKLPRGLLEGRDGRGTKKERLSFFFSGCRPRFSRLRRSTLARACTPLTKEALPGNAGGTGVGGGGGFHVARLNFRTSRVGVYKCLSPGALPSLSQFGLGRLSLVKISFTRCHYFLGHVACRNLPLQGLTKSEEKERLLAV